MGISICALAEGGTLFSWAASPGRGEASGAASILTGLSESEHGVGPAGQEFLPDALSTIAEHLRDVGYATAAFVASPRVNLSRRLDQGFALYDDRLASPSRSNPSTSEELPQNVQDWIDATASPWFIWIHANRDAGLVELDRLLSRLSQTFDPKLGAPGVLFASLRGERGAENLGIESTEQPITWRTHRIPLIWRPPSRDNDRPPPLSRRLASLLDVAPTLRAAAQLPPRDQPFEGSQEQVASAKVRSPGRDLSRLARIPADQASDEERFILLRAPDSHGEVGLASQNHLYTRRSSSLDGTGRPVPMASLAALKARFATVPKGESTDISNARAARLKIGLWRMDVLGADSPVPRLEFHLARGLVRTQSITASPAQPSANSRRSPQRLPSTVPPQSPALKGIPE